jgi:hypothetical protein
MQGFEFDVFSRWRLQDAHLLPLQVAVEIHYCGIMYVQHLKRHLHVVPLTVHIHLLLQLPWHTCVSKLL